jgi:excisionase family DNA binding protein
MPSSGVPPCMRHSEITVSQARERAAISVEQAALLLGIGRQSAYAAAQSGELPTVRIGRRVLVPVAGLLAMLKIPEHEQDS